MNRGSQGSSEVDWLSEADASMRPRFMNRGSASRIRTDPQKVQSFNEAPIHESGKFVRRAAGRHHRRCFNEAPIHESGKSL